MKEKNLSARNLSDTRTQYITFGRHRLLKGLPHVILLGLLLLSGQIFLTSAYARDLKTAVLIAEADGFRRPESKIKDKYDIEFGFQNTGGTLRVGCPEKYIWHAYGYFRFDLSHIPPDSIQKATLRLYNRYWHWKPSIQEQYRNASIQVQEVTDDSWDERAMLWEGNPSTGNTIGRKQGVEKGWNEIDVTEFIQSKHNNKASFQVGLSDKIIAIFIAREGRTDWRPQLVIQHTSNVIHPEEPKNVSTSKLPEGSLWLVHEGKYTQYSGFRDPKTGRLHYALQEAMYDAKPGDEIVLGPGRHYERVRTWDKNKIPVNNIVIRGDGFPRPIIDGSGVESFIEDTWPCNGILQIFRSSNITIENLEITNVSITTGHDPHWSGIWIEATKDHPAHNTKILNVYIHHAGNGIHTNSHTGDVTIENCEFAYNGYYESDGQQHGAYLEGKAVNKVRFSEFHHNGGQGYKDRGKFTILSGNYIHDNGNYEFDFMQNNLLDVPQDAFIIGNLFVKSPYAVNYSKIGAVGGGGDTGCSPGSNTWPRCQDRHGGVASFINNTFIIPTPAPSRAFLQLIDAKNTKKDKIELYNNIFYCADSIGKYDTLILHNNAGENITGSHNWISPQIKINATISETIQTSSTTNPDTNDPGFADPSNGIFYLSPNSPNRNAGTHEVTQLPGSMYIHPCSGISRTIREGRIDVGAYEYNDIPRHELRINVNTTTGGSVISDIADLDENPVNTNSHAVHPFYQGSRIQLTALELLGTKLLHWTNKSGDIISQKKTITLAMDSNKEVTAHFVPAQVNSLNIIMKGNGSGVIITDNKTIDTNATDQLQYNQGSMVTLIPEADEDSFFAGWYGHGHNGTGSLTIPVETETILRAMFEKRPVYQVTVFSEGTGAGEITATIVGSNGEKEVEGQWNRDGSNIIFSVPQKQKIRLRAKPQDNSSFAGWIDETSASPKPGVWEKTINESVQVSSKFINLSSGGIYWGQTEILPQKTNYWDPSYFSQGGIIPENAKITAINVYLGASTSGDGNTGIALYAGGISDTNPQGAKLIWDAGVINPGGHTGWFTLEYPGQGILVTKNTRLWIRMKNLGRSVVYFGTQKNQAGDFFPTGAYNDKFDWKTTFTEECTAEGSGSVDKWYSLFLTYTPQP